MRKVLFLALMGLFPLDADPQALRDRLLSKSKGVRDINLTLRLGLNSTPVFLYRGALLTAEPALAESYIQERLGRAPAASGRGASR